MDQQEVTLREYQDLHSLLTNLQENAGWKKLLEIAEGQVANRNAEVLMPIENSLQTLLNEYKKGEIAGIQLFMQLPGIYAADLEDSINKLELELGYDRAERTDSDGDSGGGNGGDGDFRPAI